MRYANKQSILEIRSYVIKYLRFKKASEENKLGDESDYSTGDESNGYNSNNESISGNATENEQNLTDNELIGEDLIDENTDNNHIHKPEAATRGVL